MSRNASSPAEQLLGLLFSAGAAIVAGLVLLYRIACAYLQDISDAVEGAEHDDSH